MSVYRYALTFEGKVSPHDEMGEQMGLEASATLGLGLDPAIGAEGATVRFDALISNDPDGSFSLQGEVTLGGGSLSIATVRPGVLEETPDTSLQHGVAECSITGGSGSFSGATGTMVMNFTVDDKARFVDAQTGVVFC